MTFPNSYTTPPALLAEDDETPDTGNIKTSRLVDKH